MTFNYLITYQLQYPDGRVSAIKCEESRLYPMKFRREINEKMVDQQVECIILNSECESWET